MMLHLKTFPTATGGILKGLGLVAALLLGSVSAHANVTPFSQSVAITASGDDATAAIYAARAYMPIWTTAQDATRRAALLSVLADVADHGLPVARYDAAALAQAFQTARTEGDRGRIDVAMTQALLNYMHDMTMGVVRPDSVDATIVIAREDHDAVAMFEAFLAAPSPETFLRDLAPEAPEYALLMRERLRLQSLIAAGGWGKTVPAEALAPGDAGDAVVALRDRLVSMGYLGRSVTAVYDAEIQRAVQRFQLNHGLEADGVAGASTIAALNVPADARLQSVIVAMERMRWIGDAPRGDRHIWVNLPDFTAKIIDHGRVTFSTRAVIGKDAEDRHTPEFSDMMEYMVVNPSWSVPRSITVKEYLPLLQRNRNAVGHLSVIDRNGREVPRGNVNFANYTERTFPYALRQAPSDGNALGLVKFMFPNEYNIYLHDTPAKDLFAHEVRAYSHGCVRLGSPFDFAHALLAAQSDDPEGEFDRALRSGRETPISLVEPLPVHLVYFTAWPGSRGQVGYRGDVYGRDAGIWRALNEAGVDLAGGEG
jgi:murein L,D-transpeptidase YcbB/YkuD